VQAPQLLPEVDRLIRVLPSNALDSLLSGEKPWQRKGVWLNNIGLLSQIFAS